MIEVSAMLSGVATGLIPWQEMENRHFRALQPGQYTVGNALLGQKLRQIQKESCVLRQYPR